MKMSREAMTISGLSIAASLGLVALSVYAWEAEPQRSSCDSLSVVAIGGQAIEASTGLTTTQSSPVKDIIYSFGNGMHQEVAVNDSNIQSNEVTYFYPNSGKYEVTATLQIQNGQQTEQIAPTSDCQRQINIS